MKVINVGPKNSYCKDGNIYVVFDDRTYIFKPVTPISEDKVKYCIELVITGIMMIDRMWLLKDCLAQQGYPGEFEIQMKK